MMQEQIHTVVIGAGLTGLSTALRLHQIGTDVLVVERMPRIGGVIESTTEDGFTYEAGPTTGILSSEELLWLIESLPETVHIRKATPAGEKRLIWYQGQMQALPNSFMTAVKTPLFSWRDKIRVLLEPFRPKGTNPNESLSELVHRRLGKSFLRNAVDPFIGGIYAGDPNTLIPRYALPRLWRLEQEHGSFVRGAMAKARKRKTEREQQLTKEIFSAEGGLSSILSGMAGRIGSERILLGQEILSISPQEAGGYLVTLPSGRTILCTQVVSTIGGEELPKLFDFVPDRLWQPIRAMRYAPVVQMAIGYRAYQGIPFEAFGLLVPSAERQDFLGLLCPSAIFSGRAPEGGKLFSLFLGGMRNTELIHLSDQELKQHALSLLSELLQTDALPDLIRIFRHPQAIPQYELSTGERLEAIREIESAYPGLILAGNIRDGIGISDRVTQGYRIAGALV